MSLNKKRVLFFCSFPPPYTGQNIGSKLVKDLINDDYEVDVIDLSNNLDVQRGALDKIKVIPFFIRKLMTLRSISSKKKYEVFYFVPGVSVFGILRDFVAMFIMRRKVYKIIAHVRNGNFGQIANIKSLGWLIGNYFKRIDDIIFLSEFLRKSGHSIAGNRTHVVYNTIDKEVISGQEEVLEKVWDGGTFRILFLSNFIKSKGYQEVFDAVFSLPKSAASHKFEVDFIGEWPDAIEKEKYLKLIAENGFTKSVKIHGGITDRQQIKEFYLKAHVFILPTYYPLEAQPRSIIEAMCAGTPIISTSHASIPEYVLDGHNGFLVEKRNSEQIKDAIVTLSTEKETWRKFSKNARNTYESEFSINVVKEKLLTVFRHENSNT